MRNVLASVTEEKSQYGLDEINYSSVEIGTEIPAYEIMNGQLNTLEIHIFPVLNNGTIVSLFYAAKDMNDEWFVQLSSEFVETIHEIVGESEFALVYDRNGVYLYSNQVFTLLALAENHMDASESDPVSEEAKALSMQRDTIDVLPNDVVDTISCGEMKRVATIDVKTWMDNLPALNDSRATSASLTVGKMKQPQGSNYCWAVCAAVIINKITGGSWSYSQISSMFKVANPTGGDNPQI